MKRFPCSAAFSLLALGTIPLLPMNSPAASAAPERIGSAVFDFASLAVKPTASGSRRDVVDARTTTLERFEAHISTVRPGANTHAPHRHAREELFIVLEGSVDVHLNGRDTRVGPGSLVFAASNDLHGVRNAGDTPATYYVFNFVTAATARVDARPAIDYAGPDLLASHAFDWTDLAVRPTRVGERRDVFDSRTLTCTQFECHITTINPGEAPHAPHRHPDEEMILVKEGTVEVTINGASQRIGAGSLVFLGSNDEHGLRNVGDGRATYYVLRFSTEATPKAAAN